MRRDQRGDGDEREGDDLDASSTPPASASPKTTIPPVITVMLAAVEVQAMTGTASPSWKPRAEAKKASTEASAATGSHGEVTARAGRRRS